MRGGGGFVDVDTTLSVRQPELRVEISREKAAIFGINVRDVADALRTLIGGEPVSTFREEQDQIDVWLRAQRSNRSDPRAIGDVTIAAPSGELVRLANLASLDGGARPGADRPPQPPAQGHAWSPTSTASRSARPSNACSAIVEELDLPPDYGIVFGGHAKSLGDTGTNFLIAFVLSFLFMYMILAAQFESFVHPITILLALPLSIPFALASLLLLDETLNIYSVLGLFMLFGIVKKNGILQIDYTNTLRAQGMARDPAILQANHVRLRPDPDDHGHAGRRHDPDRARQRPRVGQPRRDGQGDHRRPDALPAAHAADDAGRVLAVRRSRPAPSGGARCARWLQGARRARPRRQRPHAGVTRPSLRAKGDVRFDEDDTMVWVRILLGRVRGRTPAVGRGAGSPPPDPVRVRMLDEVPNYARGPEGPVEYRDPARRASSAKPVTTAC